MVIFWFNFANDFVFGRIWCGYLCRAGGFSELVSRLLNDRWKIEYRWLPQFQIRYSYLGTYLIVLPAIGVSACTLCNFVTVPRLVEAMSGGAGGLAFIFSAIGLVNLSLLLLLGFFASKGRAYCQFMCPIGAIDGIVNALGAKFRDTHRSSRGERALHRL
jgi:polyferredoxin